MKHRRGRRLHLILILSLQSTPISQAPMSPPSPTWAVAPRGRPDRTLLFQTNPSTIVPAATRLSVLKCKLDHMCLTLKHVNGFSTLLTKVQIFYHGQPGPCSGFTPFCSPQHSRQMGSLGILSSGRDFPGLGPDSPSPTQAPSHSEGVISSTMSS